MTRASKTDLTPENGLKAIQYLDEKVNAKRTPFEQQEFWDAMSEEIKDITMAMYELALEANKPRKTVAQAVREIFELCRKLGIPDGQLPILPVGDGDMWLIVGVNGDQVKLVPLVMDSSSAKFATVDQLIAGRQDNPNFHSNPGVMEKLEADENH